MTTNLPRSVVQRFWSNVEKSRRCWLWTGDVKKDGVGHFTYLANGSQHSLQAHRFSYLLHYGEAPERAPIFQECDDPLCVRPDHLFLETDKNRWAAIISKSGPKKAPGETNFKNRPSMSVNRPPD